MARKKFEDKEVVFWRQGKLSERGGEILDTQRMFCPVRQTESLTDRVKRMVRQELSSRAFNEGMETWEEANDFDIDDPWDEYHTNPTPYEMPLIEEIPRGLGAHPDKRVVDDTPASPDPPKEDSEHSDPE